MVARKSAAEEISFEWSHHRISITGSKVRSTLHCIHNNIDFGSESINTVTNRTLIILRLYYCTLVPKVVLYFSPQTQLSCKAATMITSLLPLHGLRRSKGKAYGTRVIIILLSNMTVFILTSTLIPTFSVEESSC